MVSYFIQLREMRPNSDFDNRVDRRTDRWLPPKKRHSNVVCEAPGPNGHPIRVEALFYHDGMTTARMFPQHPPHAAFMHAKLVPRPFKTYSIYHNRGLVWTVKYDATKRRVGDGKHDEDEEDEETDSSSESEDDDDEEEEHEYDDWGELSFQQANVQGAQSMSYAGRRLAKKRLLVQHRDQDWVQHLLPDRYQSRMTTRDRSKGGLVGELPLLVGLAAMSLPTAAWPNLLPQTIVNNPNQGPGSWQISQAQINHVDRGTSWTDKRGIVVKIFRDSQGSPEEDLEEYEQGGMGPILG